MSSTTNLMMIAAAAARTNLSHSVVVASSSSAAKMTAMMLTARYANQVINNTTYQGRRFQSTTSSGSGGGNFHPTWKTRLGNSSNKSPIIIDKTKPSSSHFFHRSTNVSSMEDINTDDEVGSTGKTRLHYYVPHNVRHKSLRVEDAVALVRNNVTIAVSGFVSQGAPEAVLKALADRYEATGQPNNLTLLFGGGPGDWDRKGLNHLAKTKTKNDDDGGTTPPMLRRTIGSHYGQTPQIAALALSNQTEAWNIPLGSVSRMIRAQSTHTPGHITQVGIGTFVDPHEDGGAINEKARNSPLHSKLITHVEIDGQDHLMYKALPIDVAIIRGTTADSMGNITIEHESLMCDQRITAAAARNSGGMVIAQVKRMAATGSLPCRQVAVPGALVDCVVVVDEQDHDELHPMSYVEKHNPAFTGELVTPAGSIEKMPLDIRKIIARRAFFALKPDKVVNLGIGLPEGVAAVAAEEDMLQYVTLSTEPGVFGGLPASGHSFGPARNAGCLVEMNQMFDFYDGGGLDMCFLGAAEISANGNVNVSRMSKDRITGPGGFIDITQSTKNVCFMSPFTAKGLQVSCPGDGTLKIDQEGSVKKFVSSVFEKTFSGDEAVRRGQKVFYVTERCVFRRTANHEVLELVEIAPGVDLQKDILDQMDFEPVVSPKLKRMDPRIYKDATMDVKMEMFGSLDERCTYHEADHTMYIDLFGVTLNMESDVKEFFRGLRDILKPYVEKKGKINVISNYDGFDLAKGLEDTYSKNIEAIQKDLYKSVKRFAGEAFHRARLGGDIDIKDWDMSSLFDEFDLDGNGEISLEELREGMKKKFQINMTPSQLKDFRLDPDNPTAKIDRDMFDKAIRGLLHTT